jgi:hypothetical protein
VHACCEVIEALDPSRLSEMKSGEESVRPKCGGLGTRAGGDKMTPSTALRLSLFDIVTTATSLPPTPPSTKLTNPSNPCDNNTEYLKTPHTSTSIMFRRVAAAVPAQAGRVLSTVARPNIASPIRASAPTLASAGRRQYHEKDKSYLCAIRFPRNWWRRSQFRRASFRDLLSYAFT